jgi:hypothetical protein
MYRYYKKIKAFDEFMIIQLPNDFLCSFYICICMFVRLFVCFKKCFTQRFYEIITLPNYHKVLNTKY